MGVFGAIFLTLKIIFGIFFSLVGLLAFSILLPTIPALFFFAFACYADWNEVRALQRASGAGPQEDSESLISGGTSSSLEMSAGQVKPAQGDSSTAVKAADGAGEAQASAAERRGPRLSGMPLTPEDPESESVLLNPAKSDRSDDLDFASPKKEETGKASSGALSAYGRRVVVIIPALNEEAALPQTLDRLNALQPPVSLVVVADAESTDGTQKVAESRGAVVVSCSEKGRAKQMNAGAREAARRMREEDDKDGQAGLLGEVAGDSIFCFLHADTLVTTDFVSIIQSKFAEPTTCCAGFVPLIAVPGRIFWMLSLCDTAKTWYCAFLQKPLGFFKGLRTLYGDQAICCCARDFFRVGGFDESRPILEDADLCEKLHEESAQEGQPPPKVCLIPRFVVTSGRRFVTLGRWRSLGINLRFAFAYLRRATPEELHAMYVELYKDIR